MSEEGISHLMMELFNRMTYEQKASVSSDDSLKIGEFMFRNGYRFVFDKWYLQEKPNHLTGASND